MTIDEAIRRLSDQVDLLTKDRDYPTELAIKLGIEALKRLKAYRRNELGSGGCRLPGETKE